MSRFARWIGWACLVVWCVWLSAAAGQLAHQVPLGPLGTGLGRFAPDLVLVLVVACAARLQRDEARAAALVAALARAATGTDSPFALVAGHLLAVELYAYASRRLDAEGRGVAAVLTGTVSAVLALWLASCAALRAPLPIASALTPLDYMATIGVATGLVAYVLGPASRRLPGCRLIWNGRERWDRVAPVR